VLITNFTSIKSCRQNQCKCSMSLSVALQTTLSSASFADPIWTRNEQQVQRHQAPAECPSPLMPAKLQFAVSHCGAQLRLHKRQLRKAAVGRSNERIVSPLTHDSHRVCGVGTNLKAGPPVLLEAPENFFGRAPPRFWPKSTISRFGERFRDGQYSLASLLLAVHGALWSWRHCLTVLWVAVISH